MRRIAVGIGSAHGAKIEMSYVRTFPATINSKFETNQARHAAEQTVGAEKVNGACEAMTISEDFANMLAVKEGCYVFIGNGTDSEGGCMLHNPHYDFNDEILETGRQYWVNLVHQQLPKRESL